MVLIQDVNSVIIAIFVLIVLLLAVSIVLSLYFRQQYVNQITQLSATNKLYKHENNEYALELEDLRSRKDWYKEILENTDDIIFIYEVSPEITADNIADANGTACVRLGYTRDEIKNLTHFDIEKSQDAIPSLSYEKSLVSSDDNPKYKYATRATRVLIEKILQERTLIYSGSYQTSSGYEFPVEVTARRIDVNGKRFIMCTGKDITNRQAVQNALNESEQRFSNFFNQSPIGVAIYDADKKLIDVNAACMRLFGAPTRNEFAKFNIFNNPFIPADIRPKMASGESLHFEMTIDFEDVNRHTLFVTSKRGEAYLEIFINSLGHDKNFRIRGYIIQVQDITPRRKAEIALRQSEKMLRQSEKMEALGSMAGGIAHDFNNILTPLLGYTEIAMRTVDRTSQVHSFLEEIFKASHRAKDLVNQVLTFSRKSEKEGQPIHLLPIVKEVLTLIRQTVPETIEINRIIKTERDIVKADATQMHQVFMNLCTNAWHAMREKNEGTLELRVMDFLLEGNKKTDYGNLEPGRYLRVSISDTGTGIDSIALERIFEPFFTTKQKGEGTGLGLSVAHNIIASCKGRITVDTELGKGSTFHVILPLLPDNIDAVIAESAAAMPLGKEHVLIVDDEVEIVEMIAHMLASLGYKPVLANSATEALKMFQAYPDRYDIVILDQVMPGMSGTQLSLEIKKVKANIPIILCSGFSQSLPVEEIKTMGINEILMKPIVMRNLAEAVRNSIDGKSKVQTKAT